MATNHIAGAIDTVDHVAAADISSGEVVEMNDVTGVALVDIATGATGAVAVTGTFALAKDANAQGQGISVEWTGTVVQALAAGTKIGYVRDAALAGDALVNVTLER